MSDSPYGPVVDPPVVNPYESPQAEISPVKPLTSQGVITENMMYHLKRTAPWLRFIGIMGFIVCGLMSVLAAAMAIGLNSYIPEDIPFLGQSVTVSMLLAQGAGMPVGFFPSFFLFTAGKKIRNYVHSGNEADLESGFKFHKFFWIFAGVFVIIYAAIIALAIVVMIAGILITLTQASL
jgi:hypothetical protein